MTVACTTASCGYLSPAETHCGRPRVRKLAKSVLVGSRDQKGATLSLEASGENRPSRKVPWLEDRASCEDVFHLHLGCGSSASSGDVASADSAGIEESAELGVGGLGRSGGNTSPVLGDVGASIWCMLLLRGALDSAPAMMAANQQMKSRLQADTVQTCSCWGGRGLV